MNRSFLLIFIITFSRLSSCQENDLLATIGIEISQKEDWVDTLNKQGILLHEKDWSRLPVSRESIHLFKKFPPLKHNIAHINLASLPTPIIHAESLSKALNCGPIYIKCDDLSGMGNTNQWCYGGNKVRKLEFLLADALLHGAQTVVTFGYAASNHAAATAIYAHALHLKPAAFLKPQKRSYNARTNLSLHGCVGTDLYAYPNNDMRKIGAFSYWWNVKQKTGIAPYMIPTGGSCPLGVLGFVNAAFELKEQIDTGVCPEPDTLFVASGSCGTLAGLLVGCKLAHLKTKIIGITTEPINPDEYIEGIITLCHDTIMLLQKNDPAIPQISITKADISLIVDFSGSDYGLFTEAGSQALKTMKEHTGITLDGTYTAKACAGFFDYIKRTNNNNEVILFWNTYCALDKKNAPDESSYKQLPVCFHDYFEKEVQPLDVKF